MAGGVVACDGGRRLRANIARGSAPDSIKRDLVKWAKASGGEWVSHLGSAPRLWRREDGILATVSG